MLLGNIIICLVYYLASPLDQFEIFELISLSLPLFNIYISFTNIREYLTISFIILLVLVTFILGFYSLSLYNWSLVKEVFYDTIHGIVVSQINKYKGQIYFPFIMTIFMFILINNLIGMIPYSFSSTSHFILTFSISFCIVIGVTILGLYIHKLEFFSLFVPSGCPIFLVPILVLIEFLSYVARNISLGLRLAANVLAGHMLLNILSGFTFKIISRGFLYTLIGILPLLFVILFSTLEFGICFIQAQVFVVLTSGYIKDSLELH